MWKGPMRPSRSFGDGGGFSRQGSLREEGHCLVRSLPKRRRGRQRKRRELGGVEV